jgi:hypothetical protein
MVPIVIYLTSCGFDFSIFIPKIVSASYEGYMSDSRAFISKFTAIVTPAFLFSLLAIAFV